VFATFLRRRGRQQLRVRARNFFGENIEKYILKMSDPALQNIPRVLNTVDRFYFYDNFAKVDPSFHIFFTVKFRKDLWRKLGLLFSETQ